MSDSEAGPWRPLCRAEHVEVGMPIRVEVDGLPPLAVFQLEDGRHYVADDTCTHGHASLSEGFIEGDEIECPWHSGRFCIKDGKATAAPAVEPIRVYPVRIVDGQVCIEAAPPD
jgi:nitrite reductase/ring-hydroxylating ferredoxin subunit